MFTTNNNHNKLSIPEKRAIINLRRSFTKPVIGITGYLGKTTLLEMLVTVLETMGHVLKTPRGKGNWDNNIKTLFRLTEEFDFAVFEFDYQGGKNFASFLRLIKPNIGIITNLGNAHLTYLDEAARIAIQRSEIVKYLANDGTAILNHDDELSVAVTKYVSKAKVIKYGLHQSADFFATDIEHLGPNGLRFHLNANEEITLPLYSVSNVYTFLACLSACTKLGIEKEQIVRIVQQHYSIPKGRGNLEKIKDFYLVDESHPGSERSVSKAARTLIGFKPYVKQIIFIVGDMTESGVKIEDRHLNMGHFLSALPIDYLITLGYYADFIAHGAKLISVPGKKIISVKNVDELLNILKEILIPGSAISVKGLGNVAYHRIKNLIDKMN